MAQASHVGLNPFFCLSGLFIAADISSQRSPTVNLIMHFQSIIAALTALAALPAAHAIYTKSSPVLQVDAKSFDQLINNSNHTSVRSYRLTTSTQ